MSATRETRADRLLRRQRVACERKLVSLHEELARLDRRKTQLLVEALAAGDTEFVGKILQQHSLAQISSIVSLLASSRS